MTEISDEVLVRRIGGGDRAAMRVLYGRHSTRTLRFLIRLVRNESTAEDLMSDVFFDVWRQASRFEERSSVSTWILSIARFKALSALRKRGESALEPEMAEAVEDDSDTPEVTSQKASKADAMRRCLGRLTLEHREVIDLVYYHEKSVEEVAEILQIPAATVKTRMFYARKKLAELLAAAGVDRGVAMTADRKTEVDLLAPWSAIEGLDEADEALLQDLLREEPELAHRIEAAADEREAAVALNEALPAPSAKARDALFARIEQHEAAKSPLKSLGLGRWFAEKFSMSTGQLAFGAAAMLVIAVQGGFLAKAYLGGTGGTYETASADHEVAVAGQTALVGFQPTATAADIAALLKDAKAEIIGGPKPGGVFLVRLSDKPMDKAALDAALAKLKANGAVVKFAAPSAGASAE